MLHHTHTVPGDVEQPPVVDPDTITTISAILTWDEPPDPNGIILTYAVRYVAVSMAEGGGRRRRRQAGGAILPECIYGGEMNIDRTEVVDGTQTYLPLDSLSEFGPHWVVCGGLNLFLLQLHL